MASLVAPASASHTALRKGALARCPLAPAVPVTTPAAVHATPRGGRLAAGAGRRRLAASGGSGSGSEAAGSSDTIYQDSLSDIAFIGLCRVAYGKIAGWQSERSWKDGRETFAGMVEVRL